MNGAKMKTGSNDLISRLHRAFKPELMHTESSIQQIRNGDIVFYYPAKGDGSAYVGLVSNKTLLHSFDTDGEETVTLDLSDEDSSLIRLGYEAKHREVAREELHRLCSNHIEENFDHLDQIVSVEDAQKNDIIFYRDNGKYTICLVTDENIVELGKQKSLNLSLMHRLRDHDTALPPYPGI